MKADKIFKNAHIFTADKNHPKAAALVVKDGKFVYVGDEAGLAGYEGEVHSNWGNSKILAAHGFTDATPDPVPGLAYFVRKDGHLSGKKIN